MSQAAKLTHFGFWILDLPRTNAPEDGAPMSPRGYVLHQDFNWHDEAGSGDYAFGEDGYLVADGSPGQVRCSRHLQRSITDGDGDVELEMRVVLGRPYSLLLCDSSGHIVVDCRIDREGWIAFYRADGKRFFGDSGPREEPHRTYWGKFRVKAM